MQTHWRTNFTGLTMLLVLFVVSAFSTLAQESGLNGLVKAKNSDAPLSYANIIVLDGTAYVNGGVTDAKGEFSIVPIKAGTYTLKVRLHGYDEFVKEDLVITEGKVSELSIAMEGGPAIAVVETTDGLTGDSSSLSVITGGVPASYGTLDGSTISIAPSGIDAGGSVGTTYSWDAPAGAGDGMALATPVPAEIKLEKYEEARDKDDRVYRETESATEVVSGEFAVADPLMVEEVVDLTYTDDVDGFAGENPDISAGLLTAGEVNDFAKWELWNGFAEDERKRWQSHWEFSPTKRYPVQLTNDDGWPVVDQPVELRNEADEVVWRARTDQSGRAELWGMLFAKEAIAAKYTIATTVDGQTYTKKAKEFTKGIVQLELPVACGASNEVDIMFVVDATGSMGDEIRYLQVELNDVIQKAKDRHKDLKMNLGSVFYRDHGDAYLVRSSPMAADHTQTTKFIDAQGAGGGGDGPEAVEVALKEAIENQPWHDDARARLLFLVLDAPPHHTPEIIAELQKQTKLAAEKGIRIIPLTASGIGKETEWLMRFLALGSNGTYTFLTDDSGIGGSHIAPTTDSYDTELLNDLLLRLIDQFTEVATCEQEEITELADSLLNHMQDVVEQQVVNGVDDAQNVPLKVSIKIFPNPTSGAFQVEMEGSPKEVYVTDLSGKLLLRQAGGSDGSRLSFDLGEYANGIYFVVAIFEEGAASERVVVHH